MADRTPCRFRLVSPEGVQFDGDAQIAIVPGTGGEIGMLARHAPLVADLKLGVVRVQDTDGAWRSWATSEGFATTNDSVGLALVEEAVDVDKIDVAAADRLIAEHSGKIADGHGGHDVYSSDKAASEKSIAWGEHLKQVAASSTASPASRSLAPNTSWRSAAPGIPIALPSVPRSKRSRATDSSSRLCQVKAAPCASSR